MPWFKFTAIKRYEGWIEADTQGAAAQCFIDGDWTDEKVLSDALVGHLYEVPQTHKEAYDGQKAEQGYAEAEASVIFYIGGEEEPTLSGAVARLEAMAEQSDEGAAYNGGIMSMIDDVRKEGAFDAMIANFR